MANKVPDKKRKDRQKQTAEVFTPNKLFNEMLAKLPAEVWEDGKTFCDPAVGNGQFLIWVLKAKIGKGHSPLDALWTVYGVDIMKDNIRECRMRLLKEISQHETITEEHIKAIIQNIVWINPKKYPQGSLQYDFSFKNKTNSKDVARWMSYVHEQHLLDEVDLPVSEEEGFESNEPQQTESIDIFEGL